MHKSKFLSFPVPLDRWLKTGLKNKAASILFGEDRRSAPLFGEGFVRDIWRAHQDGRQQFHLQLWVLILCELWSRRFEVDVESAA